MGATDTIRRAWRALRGASDPYPIGEEHFHTASASCSYGRHHLCAVDIVKLPGLKRVRCSCPCHRDVEGWST